MSAVIERSAAVREYQILQSIINRRQAETNHPADRAFWNRLLVQRATEIAEAHDTNVPDLIDAWFAWSEAVQAQRLASRVDA